MRRESHGATTAGTRRRSTTRAQMGPDVTQTPTAFDLVAATAGKTTAIFRERVGWAEGEAMAEDPPVNSREDVDVGWLRLNDGVTTVTR
jgi:hypothetical protein